MNEGQILWMRSHFCEWGGDVCSLPGRCVCWQAGIPPPSTEHCDALWCTVMHCDAPKSAEVSSATLHFEWRAMQWLIAVFIHTGSFIHWPEKHFSHSQKHDLSSKHFPLLSLSSSFQKLFFRKCPSQRIYAKYIRNSGHVYPHILKLSFSGSQIETLQACLTGWIKIWW